MTPAKKPFLKRLFILFASVLIIGFGPGVRFAPAQMPDADQRKVSPFLPSLHAATNPNPLPGDIELPMPCGAKMILRPVCIPAQGFLDDIEISLGCEDCGRPDQGFMEGKRKDTLSGPFTYFDLPKVWRSKLAESAEEGYTRCPDPRKGEGFYYFIGKYEVTQFQWEAVMAGTCPDPGSSLSADDPRPKTQISWFEAVEFTRRYTEWLLEKRPDSLPKFTRGRHGFVRLPTETEWEYAARGGHRITDAELNNLEFFPLKGLSLADFAVFTDADSARPPEKLAWIGTKRANPLGLFDTAGNAAEMVLDLFRFSVDSRRQGAPGGFVIKGGSYLKRKAEIMPGRREEMPFFLRTGAFRSPDLGFRIVLSGIVTPYERDEELKRQWAALSGQRHQTSPESSHSDSMPKIDPNKDPISELDRLTEASQSDTVRKNLLFLKNLIEQNTRTLQAQEAKTVRAILWSALFASESIRNYAMLRKGVIDKLDDLEKIEKATVPESVLESVAGDIAKASGTLNMYDAAIAYGVQSYIDGIEQSLKYPRDVFEQQFRLISEEVEQEADLSHRLMSRLELFKKHVDLYTKQGKKISPDIVLQDIVPEKAR